MLTIFDAMQATTLASPSRTSMRPHSKTHTLETNTSLLRTKHCWQNYVDYYKCVNAKGEDFRPCTQVFSLPYVTVDDILLAIDRGYPTHTIHSVSNLQSQFYHAFRALCPKAWTDRWDGQRGTSFPLTLILPFHNTNISHRGWQLPRSSGLVYSCSLIAIVDCC